MNSFYGSISKIRGNLPEGEAIEGLAKYSTYSVSDYVTHLDLYLNHSLLELC